MIPSKGRLLQCGSCSSKWFFKKKEIKTFRPEKSIDTVTEKKISKNKNLENEENKIIEKKEIQIDKKIKINYMNLYLVIIISLVALVILLDTFKLQISNFFPSINIIFDNLYETIKDITLFFKDLIR
tara:strand:- start:435 stop:815 length:381 start_codon:yes stop_codon:yes gene_type:complete